MHGYIDEYLIPRIENVLVVGRENLIAVDTVLDTGFNDHFCLPRKYFQACSLIFFGTEEYVLANGAVVNEETYLGTILLDNQPLQIVMSLTDDDEALIGTKLLDKKWVILDFENYRIEVKSPIS
ncbi:MAG: hypothetical protein ALAOOOJD_01870 [bacterium]|nr:hypothetical protein [bacterium]